MPILNGFPQGLNNDNYYSKEESLSSSTAAALGLSGDSVPDDALASLQNQINTLKRTGPNTFERLITGRLI